MSEISFWKDPQAVKPLRMRSKIHPEHSFRIGYFDTGRGDLCYSRILNDSIEHTPVDIFKINDDVSNAIDDVRIFQMDWAKALHNVRFIREKYKNYLTSVPGSARFITSDPDDSCREEDELWALQQFKDGFGSSIRVKNLKGIVNGRGGHWFIYVETPEENDYIQGLDIIEETLEYVIHQAYHPQNPIEYWMTII